MNLRFLRLTADLSKEPKRDHTSHIININIIRCIFITKKHRSESEYFRINPYANIILEKVLNIFTIKVKSRTACLAIVGILIGGSGSTRVFRSPFH